MRNDSASTGRCFLVFAVCTGMLCSGCSRSFWRSQADFDGYNLLSQKQFNPLWVLPRTSVEPDPRSRFYDPDDRDKPPLPPDDPSAAQYMQWVNGMRGYKSWHTFGQNMTVENPQWLEQFGLAPDTFHDSYMMSDGLTYGSDPASLPTGDTTRMVRTIDNLTLAQTIELASIHSRDYQTQIENLFESALQLSLDQFQFQARFLFGRAPVAPSASLPGTTVPTGILNTSAVPGTNNGYTFNTTAGVSQILPTGGQWIVGIANNTLWLFSGGSQQATSQSLLSYSLVQPLLSGAGRKFFLENLTSSERKVLYDVRTLARYRKLFFADTVVNTGGGSVSSAQSISASGSAVSNPAVISTNAGVSVGAGSTAGTTAANALTPAGYYGLLFQLQQVLNQHENVELFRVQAARLEELVAQTPYRRLPEGAVPDDIVFPEVVAKKIDYSPQGRRLRWKDAEPMSEREREQLLAVNDNPDYQAAIVEIFEQLRVGVTTLNYLQVATQLTQQELRERQLKLAYDDEIDQFKFFLGLPTDMQITIDRTMLKPFELTDPKLIAAERGIVNMVKAISRPDDAAPRTEELRFLVDRFAKMVNELRTDGIEVVKDDFRRVEANMPNRLSMLLWDESKEVVESAFQRDRLIFANVQNSFAEVARQVDEWVELLKKPELTRKERSAILGAIKDNREELLLVIQNMRVIQTGLRSELITLQKFDMTLEEAVEQALEHRLDLMNAKAKVMDSRRNMEVAANRLEAILNVVGQGSLNTVPGGSHPLDFNKASSSFQVGLQMTAPLDQVQVRNAYRAAVVSYQQARRAYMLLEDQVKYDIRTSWRQLRFNQQNFELNRKNLRQAALQYDINVANNLNPKLQVAGQAGTTNLGQQEGLNLITALGALLTAQNNLIQYWVSYERNRINIYRDMDIMQIDERGIWIDPLYQNLGGNDSSSYQNGPANDIPPEPAEAKSRSKRSIHPGIVRIGAFAPAGETKPELESRAAARGTGGRGRARLAPDEIRLVTDRGVDDADSGSDGGSGDRDREEGDVSDYGRREGNSRQYEKRRSDK